MILLISEIFKLETIVNADIEFDSFLIKGLVVDDDWLEDFTKFAGLSFSGSGQVCNEAFLIGDE